MPHPRSILTGYLGLLSLVGALGVALGLALGVLAHQGILLALGSFIPTELPLPGARPFLVGAITGLICLLAFAAPPLVALRRISPMRVIRRDLPGTTASTIGTYGCAAAGALGLLVWYSGDVFLTFWLLIGGVGVSVVFAALALVLLRSGRTLGMQAGSGWRLALAGLQRRYRENTAQIVVFGFAIMLLLILLAGTHLPHRRVAGADSGEHAQPLRAQRHPGRKGTTWMRCCGPTQTMKARSSP